MFSGFETVEVGSSRDVFLRVKSWYMSIVPRRSDSEQDGDLL